MTATAANFAAVFKQVAAGDRLVLKGDFSAITLANRSFSKPITIDARAATFTGNVKVSQVTNMNWSGGTFLLPKADVNYTKAITVSAGSKLVFDKITVSGHDTGQGVSVVASNSISITNSSFDRLRVGVSMTGTTTATISGNVSRNSSSDGFNVSDSHKVNITKNSCSGTVPSDGAHADCVQLWSIAGNKPNSDIMIADNVAIGNMQGFTSFNGTAGGGDRISMLRNRVDTSMSQGVACYECRDSNISYNVVTTLEGAQYRTSINVIGGKGNKLVGNSVGAKPVKGGPLRIEDGSDFASFDPNAAPDFSDIDFADASTPDYDPLVGAGSFDTAPDFAAAVPEPQTWVTMLAGFGLAGGLMRRRRRTAAVSG